MSWEYDDEARDSKERILSQIEGRRKRGETMEVLQAPGSKSALVRTFWGKAWCQHLQSYQVYEHRLPRGRSYLRQGKVYNLVIESGVISAEVAGSSLYEVRVNIHPLGADHWAEIQRACAGQVGSLLDLLGGKLGSDVLQIIANRECGLFPQPDEIRFSCTCPDWADMCKHVAAVLYGVAIKFESDPELFFRLRSVNPVDLIQLSAKEALAVGIEADAGLAGEDLSALFGIDLAAEPDPEISREPAEPAKRKSPAKKSTKNSR